MPPQPEPKSVGFSKGSAAKYFDSLYGHNHSSVLERVLKNSKDANLKRPDKSEYTDSRSLATDQEILDTLPDEVYFTTVCNSHNVG